MNHTQIAHRRLVQQQIVAPKLSQPHDVVGWMGAMQAQDYLGSLWAIGARLPGSTEATIEAAIADGSIVRSWPMRGTIHWMAAQDVRWMLELLAPRVIQSSQGRLRGLGIDAATLSASAEVLARALEGGKQLPRPALYEALEQAGIGAAGQRGIQILGQLAMRQMLCIGPRMGKQPTFVLLDEWIPERQLLSHEDALSAVALRYFTSHGPATRQDFVHWTGMTVTEAKAAIASVGAQLRCDVVDDQEYYSSPDLPDVPIDPVAASLLAPFDEWLLGYRDRSAVIDAEHMGKVAPGANGVFFPIVVINGRVVGVWKRTFRRDEVVIRFTPFQPWTDAEQGAVQRAAERYAEFVGKRLVVAR